MKTIRAAFAGLSFICCCEAGFAADIRFDGYTDLRAVIPSKETSWIEGGLGKTRYGDTSQSPSLQLGEIIGQARLQFSGALMAVAVARIEPEQRTFLDVTEAFLRYRPVSLNPWRWSVKLGAFFPPISLENTELGWASPWTLSSSAINSWIGEELRIIGGEGRIEWRSSARTLAATGAVYGWNDPAGILLADRGWALHDRVTGLIDRQRLPDVYARARRQPIPYRTWEFLEIDDRAGWYAGLSWDEAALGRLAILRYDNQADPEARRRQIAWETDFWSVGLSTHIGPIVVLAQGMHGKTFIKPSAFFYSDTVFESAYLLAGWDLYEWRFATRFDVFSTDEHKPGTSLRLSEAGTAITMAANWLPNDWTRLTAELLRVDSTRAQRTLDGLAARAIEYQVQLSAKIFFN